MLCSILWKGRHGLLYREDDRAVEVEVEDGYDEPLKVPISEADLGKAFVMVYTETIKSWLPPHENEPMTADDKKRIVHNIDAELSKAGVRHRME